MRAEKNLLAACHEWRRLAMAEGESISGRNWRLVAACQTALANLQPRLTHLLQSVRSEWSQTGSEAAAKEIQLNAILAELIRLEERNAATLARLQQAASEMIQQLERSGQNLQRLQRSYAGPPSAAWHSLS